jgi:ribonucleotide reductase alpha subunit
MHVTKRNGFLQQISFDKILYRLKKLQLEKGMQPLINISVDLVAQQVIQSIYDKITTTEIDDLSAKTAISMSTEHSEYADLASRIAISNLHKKTTECFSDAMEKLFNNKNEGFECPLISREILEIIRNHKDKINFSIDYSRDYLFDYFGFKTLEKSYLLKIKTENGWEIVERPQHMYMRVALGIHKENIEKVIESYNFYSQLYFTHATPTLFNSGTERPQMSSCFLMGIEDSMQGIYKCISDCALISKNAGGIGVHISNIRSNGAYIRGTNGKADGIVKMLRVFNETARYANQGSRRNGSFAIYLEPHHGDIFEFLELKKNTGDENIKCRDLFYALWVPDLLMETVDKDGDWYLMNPDSAKGLDDVYGEEYTELYNRYVEEGKYTQKIKARDLWNKILISQIETGMPYMLYKDHVNRKSNQKNIGVIKSSNLCVAPETKILTSTGYHEIQTLENQKIEVWNGEEFSETTVVKTAENQELMKISFSNGSVLECTPYHKFYIKDIDGYIEAKDLMKNYELISWVYPSEINDDTFEKITDNVKVISAEYTGRISDTYCFKESKRGMGIFNGVITGQCAEITLYSDHKEYAVCNIATLSLPKYVEKTKTGYVYNYQKLYEITRVVTRNLNNVIDYNYYPVPETKLSNMRHRPIAIGAQGLANVFLKMGIPFESPEAQEINRVIFETIYYGAMYESNQLAMIHGPYETFNGSPASKGILQFDMWGNVKLSGLWDWNTLKENIKEFGLRNSMLTALPPTASTSQILGNFESFEPVTSNIFMRSTLSGDFPVVNKYLIQELQSLGLWNERMKERIMYHNGSIQNIPEIPFKTKQVFKTIWECSQKTLMNMSRDRGVFVDQTQSLNLYMKDITPQKLSSAHFHGWRLGLKTSMYYCRSKAASEAQKFTVSVETQKAEQELASAVLACSRENKDACLMCSG